MAETSRYAVLRKVTAEEFAQFRAFQGGDPPELWVPVSTEEGHDFREAILEAAGSTEGEYVAPPAARWEGNRDIVDVHREPVVTLRSRSRAAAPAA